MLQHFAPKNVGATVVRSKPKVALVKQPSGRNKTTISDLLFRQYKFQSKDRLFTDKQIYDLGILYYDDETPKLSIEDKDIILHIIGWTHELGYDVMIDFVTRAPNRDALMWGNPTLESARLADERDRVIMREVEVGMRGLEKCGRCHSDNIIWHQLQTSSSDEGFTIRYWCVDCDNRWRAR